MSRSTKKPYRGSKAISSGCRNRGSCPRCREGRKHPRLRREPADAAEQEAVARVAKG